jgi:multidrug efflux pump subunit AcrA (membrane-fusion protein)
MNNETGPLTSQPLPEAKPAGIPSALDGGQEVRNVSLPASRLPRARAGSRRRKVLAVVGLSLLVGVVLLVLWRSGALFARQPFSGPTWKVRKEKLKLTIVARGNLESAKNNNVFCTVRSGTKGSSNSTIIKWVIDEGTEVKEGDILMELDSSGFQEQLKDKNKDVDSAYAAMVAAVEACRIQESQNESDIEAAKNVLTLAEIDLKKYKEGDYIQALKDVDGRMEMAKSDLEDWKDRAAWSARMVKKGLLSKVQADADKSRSEASAISLAKIQEEKRVLQKYMYGRTVQDLTAKLAEAKRALRRVEIQANAKTKQTEADKKSKESIYEQEMSRKKDIEAEIRKCTVKAPQDGLVVYYVPEQVRGGGGQQQAIVAQGEQVREGQKMIQIPDLSKMIVTVRVPEAFVSHLHNPDPKNKSTSQKAQVRVDSFSKHTLKGSVVSVDTVASTQDWFASDVKVYKTKIAIQDPLPGLKPGMSAEVTIFADETAEPVLIVPVQAVLGTISMGAARKCFVVGPSGEPELRDIVVGLSNEQVAEVRSGLKEGEQVVMNPQPLLKADSELRPGKPPTKTEDEAQRPGGPGAGGKGQKGGKGGPKGPGPGGPMSPGGAMSPGGPMGAPPQGPGGGPKAYGGRPGLPKGPGGPAKEYGGTPPMPR